VHSSVVATTLLALTVLCGAGAAHAQDAQGICRVAPLEADNPRGKTLNTAPFGSASHDGTSWAQAMSLQHALSVAACTDIRMRQGVYKPVVPVNPDAVTDTERQKRFLIQRPLELKGGYTGQTVAGTDERQLLPQNTVLSGDLGGDDLVNAYGITEMARYPHRYSTTPAPGHQGVGINSMQLLTVSASTYTPNKFTAIQGEASYTLFEGFTLTAAQVKMDGNGTSYTPALYCTASGPGNECSPAIRHLHFSGNSSAGGPAMWINATDHGLAAPRIADASFSGNFAFYDGGAIQLSAHAPSSGLMNSGNIDAEITRALFRDNAATGLGGAILNGAGDPATSRLRVSHSTFHGNHADEGGGAMANKTENRGSVRASRADLVLSHLTIVGNTTGSSGKGAGILSYTELNGYNYTPENPATSRTSVTLDNSILWNNLVQSNAATDRSLELVNAQNAPSPDVAVSGSIVQGGWAGTGNLAIDPQLGPLQDNDGPSHTLRPLAGSPALNAVTCIASAHSADQRGTPRPQGTLCDIGAVELRAATQTLTASVTGNGSITTLPSSSPPSTGLAIANCTGSNCTSARARSACRPLPPPTTTWRPGAAIAVAVPPPATCP
jgi:hypothetical protein